MISAMGKIKMRDFLNQKSSAIARNSAKPISLQPKNVDLYSEDCFVDRKRNLSPIPSLLTKTALILVFSIQFLTPVFAQSFDFLPSSPQGMVNDYADMLSSGEEQRLGQKLINYRDTTTNVIAIATIEGLEGNSVEEVATELFNTWRMWEGERYNGVLILISESDRKIRIEVGYGLEGAIPDVMANRIINDVITPSFRNQDVYGGLNRATDVLIQLASGEYKGTPEVLRDSSSDGGIPLDVIIIILVIIIFVVTKGGRRGKGGRKTFGPTNVIEVLFWSQIFGGGRNRGGGSSFGGGSFGGGFGGFSGGGGFGSGGGGASGSW